MADDAARRENLFVDVQKVFVGKAAVFVGACGERTAEIQVNLLDGEVRDILKKVFRAAVEKA